MTHFQKSTRIATFLAILLVSLPSFAANPYLVIDAANGSILKSNKTNDRWYPASLTKLMTAYVTMSAVRDNELQMGSPVRISNRARKMPPSRMGYAKGTIIRIDTALKIVIVKSANDVAVALAEAVDGSVEQFVARMNTTAMKIGMKNSRFANPNGLHSKNQYTTAHDLALLSQRLLSDFPQYSHWFAIPAIATPKKIHYSYNLLLERFSGTNGMKTGFVCASGYNMVASVKRNGRQLLAIILGEKSQTARAILAAKLLSQAFSDDEINVGNLSSFGNNPSAKPVNMRPILCTPEARKFRYEPGAGKAVVKSAYLQNRKIIQKPTPIRVGGIDGPPSEAYAMRKLLPAGNVKIPTPRPQFEPLQPIDPQWMNENVKLRGTIALPVWRPKS